jgi:hypothetical protein
MTKSDVRLFSDLGAAKLSEIAENSKAYTDFLKFQGRLFKQNTAVALEFYEQNPDVQFVATARQWAGQG